jgi:hypothetical protein
MSSDGTLTDTEYHPAADEAMEWLTAYVRDNPVEYMRWVESLASTALSGNRLAEVCSETLRRIEDHEPVSDRYLLGLCWTLRNLHERAAQGDNR